jgi:hypothetical protein
MELLAAFSQCRACPGRFAHQLIMSETEVASRHSIAVRLFFHTIAGCVDA